MEDLLACRVCLATSVNLYDLYKYKLKNLFEIFSGIQVSPADNYPQYLCSYCSALLLKCDAFRERCRKSQELMKYAEMKSRLLTTSQIHSIAVSNHTGLPLSISTPESTTILDTHIKTEDSVTDILYFKEEIDYSDEEPLANKVKKKERDTGIEVEVPPLQNDGDGDGDYNDYDDRIDYDINASNVVGCDTDFDIPNNEIEVISQVTQNRYNGKSDDQKFSSSFIREFEGF